MSHPEKVVKLKIDMAKYLARTCPKCKDYLAVVIQAAQPDTLAQSIDAHCLRCGYRIGWKLIRGSRQS